MSSSHLSILLTHGASAAWSSGQRILHSGQSGQGMSTDSAGCFPFLPLGCPGTPALLECSGPSSSIPCTQISCCHHTTKGPSETCPLQEFCAITNFKGMPLGQHMVPEQSGLNIKADGELWTWWQTTEVDQILGLVPSSQGGVLQPSRGWM